MDSRKDPRPPYGPYEGSGPFVASQIPPGSRYELRDGHALYCAPTGGDGARRTVVGAQVLATDPAVEEAGIDAGYTFGPGDLRAPDVAVGNVPDKPGWIPGVPPLAVEYAGRGQDEAALQQKIADFLEAGTRWVWVVRLLGPRRVEVHTREGVRTYGPGEALHAPDVLKNAVPVEAMYDQDAAHEATLRNLLQRRGYESLEEVREAARAETLRTAILDLCEVLGIATPDERKAALEAMALPALEALRVHLKRERRWD